MKTVADPSADAPRRRKPLGLALQGGGSLGAYTWGVLNSDISLDALLASASLPNLFPPVEIDGEAYWDGGFAGNPSLLPMLGDRRSSDLLVVQLVPDRIEEIPLEPQAIRRRVGEIVFHASLLAELRTLAELRKRCHEPELRLHRIGPPPAALAQQGSAADRGQAWLRSLHDEGKRAGQRFLLRHGKDLGVRDTLDLDLRAEGERHAA